MSELPVEGDVFGGFEIERELGRGGMGIVYLARQTNLSRQVALKVIAPQFAQDGEFELRFEREARHAASIDHPNVVPVFETGRCDELLYMSMRYVNGTDLRARLDDGPLEHTEAVRIVAAVGDALDAAHGAGLIHRDVKPGNILLTGDGPDGHVYLGDFGLTKDATSETGGLTLTGQVVGTLDYMAPEQMEGGDIDARVDVYALGCVLFQMLSGRVPYEGTGAQKMFAHATKPPPSLAETAPELAPMFDPIIARAMAKTPDERYPSAGDLARAAMAAAEGERVAAPERSVAMGAARPAALPDDRTEPRPVVDDRPTPRSRTPMLVAAGAAALLAVGGVVALVAAGGDDEPARGTKGAPVATPTTNADAGAIETVLASYYEQPAAEQCQSLVTERMRTALYGAGSDALAACETHQEQRRSTLSEAQRDVTVGNVRVSGATATADVAAGGLTLQQTLVKADGRWQLDDAGSVAATATATAEPPSSAPRRFGQPATFTSIPGNGPDTEVRIVVARPVNAGRDRRGNRSASIRFSDDFGQPGPVQRARFVNLPITLVNTGANPFRGDIRAVATAANGREFGALDRRDIAQRGRYLGRLPDWTTGESEGIGPGQRQRRFLTFAVPRSTRLLRFEIMPDVLIGPNEAGLMQPIDGVAYR